MAGVYNAGIEHSLMGRFLEQKRVSRPPVLVGHDLGPEAREMLREGAMTLVIDQNPDMQIRKALAILARRFGIDGIAEEDPVVPFTVHVRDSI